MPSTKEIRAARIAAGMTQAKAGSLVSVSARGWQDWELGKRPINQAAWELFLIKTKAIRKKNAV